MDAREQQPRAEARAAHTRSNGDGTPMTQAATYCTHCGTELVDPATARRFGEPFCSEAHADAFATEARAARVAAAALAESPGRDAGAVQAGDDLQKSGTGGWSFRRLLKLAACCGAPLLAVVFLAGGGGALLGAGAAALPYLALLACPLAMFFMMRAMRHHGEGQKDGGHHATPGPDDRMGR